MINVFRWCSSEGYATTRTNGNRIFMHRLILGAKKGQIVDHINGDRLDNRKRNLRICTTGENLANQSKPYPSSTSGLRGVSFNKEKKRWVAQICLLSKNTFIGYFDSKEEAHSAYKKASKKAHGKFSPY